MAPPVDFTSQDYFRDPAAGIERLRSAGPVVEIRFPIVGRTWITTTEEAADRVLKDGKTFTLRRADGAVAGMRWWMPGLFRTLASNMLTTDEPDHTRLRSIVDEAFRRRAVLEMEPRIVAIAEQLASELFAEGNPADLVDRYARRLPLSVICELLGLPAADRPRFMVWAANITGVRNSMGFVWRMMTGARAIKRYLEAHLESVRAGGGEGLIAELVRAEKDGARISREEVLATVFLLLFAGHETTTHLISGSVYELLKNPGLRSWLEQDRLRIDLAVEEFLRFISPVQFSKPRFVRRDIELSGVRLRRGDRIMARLVAANFDPAANEHPERLDLARDPNRHVAFGSGIHFCLGHQLARIEGRCALRALFGHFPGLALAVDASQIRWRPQPGLRAIENLPVTAGRSVGLDRLGRDS
jgi:cytochrome P450 PksS